MAADCCEELDEALDGREAVEKEGDGGGADGGGESESEGAGLGVEDEGGGEGGGEGSDVGEGFLHAGCRYMNAGRGGSIDAVIVKGDDVVAPGDVHTGSCP